MLLNEMFQVKYPIMQGAMAHISTAKFAANVSNVGALGIIGTGAMNAQQAEEAIMECKALTNKPFGVNVMLMNRHAAEIIDVICRHQISFVTTGAGNPGVYCKKLRDAGCKIIPVVASVALAKRLEPHVDALIVEGYEAGGHIGESTTLALLPQVLHAVKIPVIAAGGIASGEQLAAVLLMGAIGAQIGTRLLVAEECEIHENYKKALLKANDRASVVTGRASGAPVRVLNNQMAREYIKLESKGATLEELEHLTLGSLRKSVFEGDIINGSLMAGQVSGMLTKIEPLDEIFETIMIDTKSVLHRSTVLVEKIV